MTAIVPIQTKYKGYNFRSRLEARWAVYFDAMGWKWEYEKEGYDLGGDLGYYLPDFWLETVGMWVEVKPKEFTENELLKCAKLTEITGSGTIMLDGVPECKSYLYIDPEKPSGANWSDWLDLVLSNYHGYPFDDGRFYVCTAWDDRYGDPDQFAADGGPFYDVVGAVNAARSARFEHNEFCRLT